MTIDRNRAAQVLRRGRTLAATTADALATILTCAAPPTARADTDSPCSLAATFLCRFIPIAPELDRQHRRPRQVTQGEHTQQLTVRP